MSDLQGLHLHFDCPSGAAGDMTLGALFDLGVPESVVREALAALPVGGYALTAKRTLRAGMAGVDVKVVIDAERTPHVHHHDHDHEHADHDHGHPHDLGHHDHHHHSDTVDERHHTHAHRHYSEISKLVDTHTSGRTRDLALAIFQRIAAAEAKLHGVEVGEVAFHEVGAIDSIVDVVGSAAALAWLAPASVSSSPIALGHGTVRTAHGILPVPAPATLEICRAAGVATIDGGIAMELCTPTGAAILAAVVERWGAMPPLDVRAIGYGAGGRDFPDRPNLMRAVVGVAQHDGKSAASEHEMICVEANLDDMNPELCEHVAERLFLAGAVDVWWTPVMMKKSRPAFVLGVLVFAAKLDESAGLILAETTSLGVRWVPVERRVLDRAVKIVETVYGPVVVKIGSLGGKIVNVAPEYEACRVIARERGVPLKEIYAAALTAFRERGRT